MSVKYHGVVVPESTDLADGPKAFRDLTDFGNAMPIFATLAERDGWTSPPNGALCTVLASAGVPVNVVQQYITGTGWKSLEVATVGEIKMWPTATPPTNHLLCNGQAVPAGSDYDQLRAIVGANVPNLVDKFVLGSGVKAVNATGGAATVALTVAQLPAHNHGSRTQDDNAFHGHGVTQNNAGSHSHTADPNSIANYNVSDRYAAVQVGGGWFYGIGAWSTSTAPDHTHSVAVQGNNAPHGHYINNDGSNQAHENMPPYVVMAYIIRAK